MVEAKQCPTPKKSKLLKTLEMQKNEFREPISKPRKIQRIEQAPIESVMVDRTNYITPSYPLQLQKEMSFGPEVVVKQQQLAINKRTMKASRKGQENGGASKMKKELERQYAPVGMKRKPSIR